MGQEADMAYLGPLPRFSPGCNQASGQAVFSSEGSTGEDSTSKLIWVVGRIQFSGVTGPKALTFG